MADPSLQQETELIRAHIEKIRVEKRERLKNLDFLVLDNSIRESTVGQLRSHTLQNKIEILKHVRACGMKDIVVASFSNMKRVDDLFVQHLLDTGEDFNNFFSFSEVTVGLKKDKTYNTETIPSGLKKNKKYGLKNTIFEVDIADENCDWNKFTVQDMCDLLYNRCQYVYNEIAKDARLVVNLRDFSIAMAKFPHRLLAIVKFFAQLPKEKKLYALAYEDGGDRLPEEVEAWTASVRRVMNANGWSDGRLIVHCHQKWDLQTATQLDCISAGADGIWASLCDEGASLGHSSSTITLMNLIRMGNKKVLEKYNCVNLRKAAQAITKITTGKPPHHRQSVYGERALDFVFADAGDFNMAEFFGVEAPNRMTTLATEEMIVERLTRYFGENPQFNKEIAHQMKKTIFEDLASNRKEEYMSEFGLAVLFDRSGGKITEAMSKVMAECEVNSVYHEQLIGEIQKEWNEWDAREEDTGDGCLEFDSFYHGFMAPYFGCYRCPQTKNALKALDMDTDGLVDWNEFMVYVKWALRQYPSVKSADDLMSIVFEKGLIPAMHDELKRRAKQ